MTPVPSTPLSQLLQMQEFHDALGQVLVPKHLLSCSWRELRLLVNKALAGQAYVSKNAWEDLFKDEASPTVKLDPLYQQVREVIETAVLEAKVESMDQVLEAKTYLDLQKHQWLLNTRFPNFGREDDKGIQVGNITVLLTPPAALPPPPLSHLELAARADEVVLNDDETTT